jgi:hypothetical protein
VTSHDARALVAKSGSTLSAKPIAIDVVGLRENRFDSPPGKDSRVEAAAAPA